MPTPDEIYAQLTGPGGAFEVVIEDVAGRPTEVYKERMRSLREIPAVARGRGDDQTFIVYGDRRIGFATFVDTANSVSHGLAELGVGHGDRVAILAQNCPEWCLAFWGAVDLGAVAVGLNGWWKADEIVYGLQDSGAKVLVADRKRVERVAGDLDECPDLEHVLLIDCDPGRRRPRRRRPGPPLRRAHRRPHPRRPDHTDRRGRPRRHPLHERHDRAARRARSAPTAT